MTDQPLRDQRAREEALDTNRSILVQAPAGSGKTELLTKRFLKLLAEVDEPEEVLAITFTKAATAEMRYRVLEHLDAARNNENDPLKDAETAQLARAALHNSDQRGWRLLEQAQRLNIQTIDSLCLRIARQMPLTAKLSASLPPTENAQPLYRSAARKTFDHLGSDDAELNTALAELLSLRDSNLRDCETLLARMLESRDQWMRAFTLSGDIDWESARANFEQPFQREVERVLTETHQLLSSHPTAVAELLELANYACNGERLSIEIQRLAGAKDLPEVTPDFINHWECLCALLLTKGNNFRAQFTVREGFPPADSGQKARMIALVKDLESISNLRELLSKIRQLPPARYTEEQWNLLRHIFTALRQAVKELQLVFAERGAVDFVELGIAALEVLDGKSQSDVADQRIRHLLVDEFQDTSRRQHQLIAELLRHWEADEKDGRTFFLVGDPMQSIYMFRQADVELFELVRERGFHTSTGILPARALDLETNFRSHAGLVDPLNELFARVFESVTDPDSATVAFLPSVAGSRRDRAGALTVHTDLIATATKSGAQGIDQAFLEADDRETSAMMDIIQRHLPTIEAARRTGREFTLAVLGSVKNHLVKIAKALRDESISFRAVELEELGQRQEILDLQSLTRALLHPMDRIAWLALLRAPWCGLPLRDIHLLCGNDARSVPQPNVESQIQERLVLLDQEAQNRVRRMTAILEAAAQARYSQMSMASWIERTWTSLGGPACVDTTGYENALTYFRMLEDIQIDGIDATGEEMEDQLGRLFARSDPRADERCGVQLMTIHKAKGLGFNVVLMPGLHKKRGQDSASLIRYLERGHGTGTELLAAPLGNKGEDSSQLNQWVRRQREHREAEEYKRLLYVGCTRARDELHLFATATVAQSKVTCTPGTLLQTAWPALEARFDEEYRRRLAAAATTSTAAVEHVTRRPLDPNGTKTVLYRVPGRWRSAQTPTKVSVTESNLSTSERLTSIQQEGPQASRRSRTLGTIAHALLERAGGLLNTGHSRDELLFRMPRFHQQATLLARQEGFSQGDVDSLATKGVDALRLALEDDLGGWILGPQRGGRFESSWTGILDGVTQTLRIDRSFFAGSKPLSHGSDCLWIIDYKTADMQGAGLMEFLAEQRSFYVDQLEKYARMMSLLHGKETELRAGLYYPLLQKLDWWKPFSESSQG